jgi:ribose transport system permease protein
MKKEFGLFTLLIVLCLIACAVEVVQQLHGGIPLSSVSPRFLSSENLLNTANLIGMYGIFSIGAGIVIITGGIDLSVGSMCALTGVLLSIALKEWHWTWPLVVLFILFVPMAFGSAHGFLITRMRLQPFIVTLCGLLIYRGLARFIAHDSSKGFVGATGFEIFSFLASGRLFHLTKQETINNVVQERVIFEGIPMPLIILIIVAIAMWFVLHRSIYGRYLLAVGRNEEATRFSGVNTKLVIGSSYVIAGLLTGIASIMFAFYSGSVSPAIHGNLFELYGIAAAVLGGCSLRGGEGSIVGIVIGTALLQVLRNLVNILGIDSSLDYTVMGSVVLIGVLVDQIIRDRVAKRSAR